MYRYFYLLAIAAVGVTSSFYYFFSQESDSAKEVQKKDNDLVEFSMVSSVKEEETNNNLDPEDNSPLESMPEIDAAPQAELSIDDETTPISGTIVNLEPSLETEPSLDVESISKQQSIVIEPSKRDIEEKKAPPSKPIVYVQEQNRQDIYEDLNTTQKVNAQDKRKTNKKIEKIEYSYDFSGFGSDRGLFGSIGYHYMYNDYRTSRIKNSQAKFMQEYKLGYRGNIYSPKLLDYSVMGLLRFENIKSDTNGIKGETKIDSEDYKLDFNFLKNSKTPFRITAQKTTRPVSVLYVNTLTRSQNDVQSIGISGSIRLNIFDITYSASDRSGVFESLLRVEDRETRLYKAALRKSDKDYNFQLGYRNINQIYTRDNADLSKSVTDNKEKNINLLFKWDINDDFTFNTYSYYKENEYRSSESLSSTTTSASASLLWNPKTKHSATISLQAYNLEDNYYTMNNISMNQGYNYRVTKNLMFSQQSNYSIVESNSVMSDNMSLGTGLSYTKPLSSTTRLSLSGNINYRTNSNDANNSLNADTYRYYARIGLNQKIDSLNSSLSIGLNYDSSISTLEEENERKNAYLTLMTAISRKLSNNFRASYNDEQTKLIYKDGFLDRDVTTINIEDNINYKSRIGFKGNLTSKIGVYYSYTNNNFTEVTRLIPKCDIKFDYRLGDKLIFKSSFHVNKDLSYDILTSRFDNKLTFKSRYTMISLGYNYNKIISGESNQISTRDTHIMQASYVRKF